MLSRSIFRLAPVGAARSNYGRTANYNPPGFNLTKVEDDITKGFRAQFQITGNGNALLKYSQQTKPRSSNPDPKAREPIFEEKTKILFSAQNVVRMLSVLESSSDSTDYSTRGATGTFSALGKDYEFRLTGKSTIANGTNFDFVLDAGHAVILQRFLTSSLLKSMDFDKDEEEDEAPKRSSSSGNYRRDDQQRNDNRQSRR